jgi:putative PIN family toxin of toxin-antitoxin system
MTIPRVVLDTNVFVAAHWNPRSASAAILEAARDGSVTLCESDAVEQETRAVLRAIRAREEFYFQAVELLLEAERVCPHTRLSVVPEDPNDNKLLECAAAAGANYLITSDKHLLRIGRWDDTLIVTPGEFRRRLGLA